MFLLYKGYFFYCVFLCVIPYFLYFLAHLSLDSTDWKSNFPAFSLNMMCYTWKMTNATFKKGQVQFNIKTSKQAFHFSAKVCTGSNISCVDQSDMFGWGAQTLFMRSVRV